jgi:hypothetical protein
VNFFVEYFTSGISIRKLPKANVLVFLRIYRYNNKIESQSKSTGIPFLCFLSLVLCWTYFLKGNAVYFLIFVDTINPHTHSDLLYANSKHLRLFFQHLSWLDSILKWLLPFLRMPQACLGHRHGDFPFELGWNDPLFF